MKPALCALTCTLAGLGWIVLVVLGAYGAWW